MFFLFQPRYIECVVARAQVFSIREHNSDAEDAQLGLSAEVPEPLMRTKRAQRISDFSGIEKRAGLYRDHSVAVDVLVGFPIRKEVVSSQWGAAFAAVARADVRTHGQIGIALQAEHEELVEWRRTEGLADAELLLHLVIVALRAGEPMPTYGALQLFKRAWALRPPAGNLR